MISVTDLDITSRRTEGLAVAVWRDWSCLVRLVISDNTALDAASEDLKTLMRTVESAASRFRPESELSRVNDATGRTHAISPTLARLVSVALEEAEFSRGLVDPTLGRDLMRLGYDRDITRLYDDERPALDRDHKPKPDWSDVRVDRDAGLVFVPKGCALDLGAIGKAHTADWAAGQLHERYGCDVLVEIGGDIALAGRERDWQITVSEKAGLPGQRISLRHGGLATSTTTIRAWRRAGTRHHHVVDPQTGRSVDGPWRTASAIADSATRANTFSTAALVAGPDAVNLLRHHQATARLVAKDGSTFRMGHWPVAS